MAFETSLSPRAICTALVERSGERAELYVGHLPRLAPLFSFVFVSLLLLISSPMSAQVFDSAQVFSPWAKVVSVESALTHFGSRLSNDNEIVQGWNLSGRFSLLPFGTFHLRFLGGAIDGAPEVGLEPTFERFSPLRQNFAGVGLHIRYNFSALSLGSSGSMDRRIDRSRRDRFAYRQGQQRDQARGAVHEPDSGRHRGVVFSKRPPSNLSRSAGRAHLQRRTQRQQPQLRTEYGRKRGCGSIVVLAVSSGWT